MTPEAKHYDPLTSPGPGTGLPHPDSYWKATAGSPVLDDGPLKGNTEAEVAIIGGGYTGLSCAYHLARHHGIRPVVLEANLPGWGCSGRNGGFARMALGRHTLPQMQDSWGRQRALDSFAEMKASLQTVRDLILEGSIDCDAEESGHLKIAHRPERVAGLQAEVELLNREFNYPAEFLDARQVQEHHIGGPQSWGALRIPDALSVHPLKLALGVCRMARNAGAIVHRASPVTSWAKTGGQHTLTVPGGTVLAKHVVVATNGYTPPRLHDSVRATLLPVLSHIIVTRPLTADETRATNFVTRHVLTDSRKLVFYWRRLADDRILFGGRGLVYDAPERHPAMRSRLLADLRQKLPGLEEVTVDYDWHGWVCLTGDFMPHVHHAEDDPTCHYALGYQGSGVSMALHAGRILAQRIAGQPAAMSVPPFNAPLPRVPFHDFARIGQSAMYAWYKFHDRVL